MTPEERTLLHESGHLAAAVVLDLEPTRAEITPGNRDHAGAVYWRLGDMTPELATRIAKMTLCGPAMGTGELPSWPLCETRSRDEKLVSVIINHLGFDEPKYDELQLRVWESNSLASVQASLHRKRDAAPSPLGDRAGGDRDR